MTMTNYNIRVYGLLIRKNKVLITHENRAGMLMTKFPGGGHKTGEGLADCLIREFQEELGVKIVVGKLFYVNEFLQISKFNPQDQLISFYYFVSAEMMDTINTSNFDPHLKPGDQIFEWVAVDKLDNHKMTFPIDKIVVEHLQYSGSILRKK